MNEDITLGGQRDDTYELFAMLVGYAVMNHQKIISASKRLTSIFRDEVDCWKFGRQKRGILGVRKVNWVDPNNALPNTLSDADFYNYFEPIMRAWHDVQFRLAGKPKMFSEFPDLLMKILRDENKHRNHLVHSEYTWNRDLIANEELNLARPQNSSGSKNFGYVQVSALNRLDFIEFINFQISIVTFLEDASQNFGLFLYDDIYISSNSSDFDIEIFQFAESEEVSPGPIFDERDNYISDPSHDEIQRFITKNTEVLCEIEMFRRNMKIKSTNCKYETVSPVEGSTIDFRSVSL